MPPDTITALEFEKKRRALGMKVDRAFMGWENRRSTLRRGPPPPGPPLCRAAQNYIAMDNLELSLTMDEPVTVLEKKPDGYWRCVNFTGHSGFVPSNVLREESPTPQPPPPSRRTFIPKTLSRKIPVMSMRHEEIGNYLFNNIRELPLDTMDFPMPEHILFNYVLVNGGLTITADEWRDFLIVTSEGNLLFKFGTEIKEFTEEIFEAAVWRSERDGWGLVFGPKGIIRFIKQEEDPPAKKRKRDIIENSCPHM
ncbi:hypothetical protein IFR05_012937 [Cadophora sp. M221]|nr:hypothetical protein IFR05_012937 [Cadophora sp. M221]